MKEGREAKRREGREGGREEGRKEGRKKGRVGGRKEGRAEGRKEVRMLRYKAVCSYDVLCCDQWKSVSIMFKHSLPSSQ